MKRDENMDYKTIKNQIKDMVSDNHKDFIRVVVSMEKVLTMKVLSVSTMRLIWIMRPLICFMRNLITLFKI